MAKTLPVPPRGFSKVEFKRRVQALQKIMIRKNLGAVLFTSEAEIRYFTGFMTQFWQSPTRPWYLIILCSGAPVAVIPTIGVPLMKDCFISEIHSWSAPAEFDDGISLVLKVIKEALNSKVARLGLPMGKESVIRMPLSDIFKIKEALPEVDFIDITRETQKIRMIKSPLEIEKIRYVCTIVSEVFSSIPDWFVKDMPLIELFRNFKIKALELGVDEVSYLVGASGKGGYFDIIAPPTVQPVQDGDVFMLDTGCQWDGYFCDFDRNFAVGYVTDEAYEAHTKLVDAIDKAVGILKPGKVTARDLYLAMDSVLRPNQGKVLSGGDDIGRYGHGLGIQLTECPSHTSWDMTIIKPGMVLTLEPSIVYSKKKFLMVAEENIEVTKSGVEFLTKRGSRDLKVLKS